MRPRRYAGIVLLSAGIVLAGAFRSFVMLAIFSSALILTIIAHVAVSGLCDCWRGEFGDGGRNVPAGGSEAAEAPGTTDAPAAPEASMVGPHAHRSPGYHHGTAHGSSAAAVDAVAPPQAVPWTEHW